MLRATFFQLTLFRKVIDIYKHCVFPQSNCDHLCALFCASVCLYTFRSVV